jgi:hypothetical protein
MVPYKNNKNLARRNRTVPASFNPNQLVYDLGFGAMEGAGNLAVKAVKGIVSAFQNRGASRQEIKTLVAPLAKSLTYTSRKPKFTKAEGGMAIEHIENISVPKNGHTYYVVDSNLFIWLKNIANQFEEYQIKLWFAWNPICPATATGQVLMAFDYDPDDDDAGAYEQPADYFNTADHCVSAIWAPGALSPQKSGWLKTGNTSDPRFYSPGRFHINVTDASAGYLTVKYQVSLRKPQPNLSGAETSFFGYYNTSTNLFANRGYIGGEQRLIKTVTDDVLILAATPGYKVVVWSTDATVASVTNGATNARGVGTRTGSGASWVTVVKPGVEGSCSAVVTTPGGLAAYKVTIFQLDINPLYFGF